MNATMRKIWNFDWRSALIAAPFAVLLAWVVTSVIDRAPPISYRGAWALQREVPAGGQLAVRFEVQRYDVCRALNVYRYVADPGGTEYAVTGYTKGAEGSTAPGTETYDRTIVVPETVPPGPAHYFIRLSYACNWVQVFWPITVESPRIAFVVLPNPNDAYHLTPLPVPER